MPKDRFSIYLRGFEKRFTGLNLKYAAKRGAIERDVDKVIRRNIALGSCNRQNIKRQESILTSAFLHRIEIWYEKEMGKLKQWESDTLVKLFPELNEPQ